MSHGSTWRTKLGDVVHVRFDDDGYEHITIETDRKRLNELELVPEPSGLAAFVATNRRKQP